MNPDAAKIKKRNREKGYTMIELMTVMVIIGIITAFGIANYHEGNRQVVLDIQANQLAQDLRKMQEWALSAHQVSGISMAGYGIYIAQGEPSYTIYTDDNTYHNGRYDYGVDSVVQEVTLNASLEVLQCTPAEVSVNFIPPDPITKISDGAGAASNEAIIELRAKGTSMVRKIHINRAGLIYVE